VAGWHLKGAISGAEHVISERGNAHGSTLEVGEVRLATAAGVRDLVNRGPMSSFQIAAVGTCVVLNMLDGFDVLVMAFTAASVSAEWGLSGTQLGALLSAGLLGMAAGSLLLAPWADRFGRRPLIVFGLVLIGIGMMASAFARDVSELAATRVLTGAGIGVILASMSVITSEYSSDRWGSAAISIMTTGYTIGVTVGGVIAAALIGISGWRAVFFCGGLMSLLLLPVVLWRLPESLDFLLAERPRHALRKLNHLMRAMGHPVLSSLPEPDFPAAQAQRGLRLLISRETLRSTLFIWTAFFLLMSGFYFVMSWTPKLLVQGGLSPSEGITGGVLLNLGGIGGGVLFGLLASRLGVKGMTAAYLLLSSATLALFGVFAEQLATALFVAVLIGACVTGAMAGLYSLAPLLYAPGARVTGVGWAIGIGRLGAIVAPLLAGALLDQGWTGANLFYLFCLPFLLSLLAILALRITA